MTKNNLLEAIDKNDFKRVKYILETCEDLDIKDINIFSNAVINCSIDIIKVLLNDSRIDPSEDESYSFIKACYYCRIEVVELLLKDQRITPYSCSNAGLGWAVDGLSYPAKDNYFKLLKLLLKQPEIVKNINNAKFIKKAFNFKHLEAVESLWNITNVREALKSEDKNIYNEINAIYLINNF